MRTAVGVGAIVLAVCVGCGEQAGRLPAEPPKTEPQVPAPPRSPTADAGTTDPELPSEAAGADTVAESDRQNLSKATAGASGKGSRYGGGIVTEPLRARFRVAEKLTFGSVEYALKLFKAQHGRLPRTNDEFSEKIIRANQIALPELPAGDEYWYDADNGQLMVRHPDAQR